MDCAQKSIFQELDYIKLLGQGQFGEVYLVQDRKNTLYAMKIIKQQKLKELPQLAKYIESEIMIMEHIQHPNVPQLISGQKVDGTYKLLLEYCEGGDMNQHLKSLKAANDFTIDTILNEFYQILNTFQVLHSNHIIHRDIKPDNILYKNGQPKIADFGLSKQLDSQSDITSTSLGTPFTMAPEVYSFQQYSYPADIYSLGVLLYYMLYGNYPYTGDVRQLKRQAQIKQVKFPLSTLNVNDEIKTLILDMLSYNPKDRPTISKIKSMSCFQKFQNLNEEDIRKSILPEESIKIIDKLNIEIEKLVVKQEPYLSSNQQEKQIQHAQQSQRDHRNTNCQKDNQNQKIQLTCITIDIEKYQQYLKSQQSECSQFSASGLFSFVYTQNASENLSIRKRIEDFKELLYQIQQLKEMKQIFGEVKDDIEANFKQNQNYQNSFYPLVQFLFRYIHTRSQEIGNQLKQEEFQRVLQYDEFLKQNYDTKLDYLNRQEQFGEINPLSQKEINQLIGYCHLYLSQFYTLREKSLDEKTKNKLLNTELKLSLLILVLQQQIQLNQFDFYLFQIHIKTIQNLQPTAIYFKTIKL